MDIDEWFESLPNQVALAAQQQFTALVENINPAEVAAFGMWSDADGSTLVCGVCLEGDIRTVITRTPELTRDNVLWETGEWLRTAYDLPNTVTGDLDQLVSQMSSLRERISSGEMAYDDPTGLRYMVWQVGAIAMAILFEDGFFDPWADAVQLFQVSDKEVDLQTQVEWVEMCNTDEAADAFEYYASVNK